MIALLDLYSQPRLIARLTNDLQGRAVRQGLHRPSRIGATVIHSATAVLVLPEKASDYAVGASKQTLRRKVRKAQGLGIHWEEVADPVDVCISSNSPMSRSVTTFKRSIDEKPRQRFLLAYPLWLVAYAADPRPVLLSVTPFDGEWATLTLLSDDWGR